MARCHRHDRCCRSGPRFTAKGGRRGLLRHGEHAPAVVAERRPADHEFLAVRRARAATHRQLGRRPALLQALRRLDTEWRRYGPRRRLLARPRTRDAGAQHRRQRCADVAVGRLGRRVGDWHAARLCGVAERACAAAAGSADASRPARDAALSTDHGRMESRARPGHGCIPAVDGHLGQGRRHRHPEHRHANARVRTPAASAGST